MDYRNYGSTQYSKPTKVLKTKHTERSPLYATYSTEYSRPTLFGVCRTSFLFGVYLLMYLTFLLTGAAVFSLLEAPEEQALRTRLNVAIRNFRTANPTVAGL